MIGFYRRYVIIACVVAGCIAVGTMTVWTLVAGYNVSGTIPGLIVSLVVLFVSLGVMVRIMARKADQKTAEYISLYNDQCDPEAFLAAGQDLADVITVPFNEPGSWFMSYYAQASLDAGQTERAKNIEESLYHSIDQANIPLIQAAIIANLVPLAEKVVGYADTLPLLERGISLIADDQDPQSVTRRQYLESQRAFVEAQINHDEESLLRLFNQTVPNDLIPMRIRVEYAWQEARIHYAQGDQDAELRCLQFVADHGNRLALTQQARQRLGTLRSNVPMT